MTMYGDKILDMVRRVGEPTTQTSTTTMAGEPLDISSLMMLLMFSDMFKQPGGGTQTVETLGETPIPPGRDLNLGAGTMPEIGAGRLTPQWLLSLLGGGTGGAGAGGGGLGSLFG